MEPTEMFVQFKDPTVVKTKSFPNRVPTLDSRIERADSSSIPVHKVTIDVYDQIAVSFIKFLQHNHRGLKRI